MLNFEPHKPTYKISIEVGQSVGRSFIARIQPTIIRLTLRRSAIIISAILRSTSYAQTATYYRQARAPLISSVFKVFLCVHVCYAVKQFKGLNWQV